jgi:gamma-glutamyl:cysteine ligase YbdK (ATP-grasp superfamily)
METTVQWLKIFEQISLLLGIWVAIYGIDSWRREHVGRRQMELAEDTLALFYEAADAIRHMRHPFSTGTEHQEIKRGEGETESAFKARQNASIVFVRYNQHQETFNKLHAMRYRFMAQIGKDKAKAFDDLRDLVNSIMLAARSLARLWSQDTFLNEAARTAHHARIEKYEAIFWEGLEESDPINPKLAQVIIDIEGVCRAVIDGKGTLYGFLNWRFRNGS